VIFVGAHLLLAVINVLNMLGLNLDLLKKTKSFNIFKETEKNVFENSKIIRDIIRNRDIGCSLFTT